MPRWRNSFDGEYEMLYGSYAAIMMRESKAWMFKEVDSPLLGWEVYAAKTSSTRTRASRWSPAPASRSRPRPAAAAAEPVPLTNTPLFFALGNFLATPWT